MVNHFITFHAISMKKVLGLMGALFLLTTSAADVADTNQIMPLREELGKYEAEYNEIDEIDDNEIEEENIISKIDLEKVDDFVDAVDEEFHSIIEDGEIDEIEQIEQGHAIQEYNNEHDVLELKELIEEIKEPVAELIIEPEILNNEENEENNLAQNFQIILLGLGGLYFKDALKNAVNKVYNITKFLFEYKYVVIMIIVYIASMYANIMINILRTQILNFITLAIFAIVVYMFKTRLFSSSNA